MGRIDWLDRNLWMEVVKIVHDNFVQYILARKLERVIPNF